LDLVDEVDGYAGGNIGVHWNRNTGKIFREEAPERRFERALRVD
jgi:hypothetical protein